MTLTTTKWTIGDYHCMIRSGILSDRKVELLKGEIIDRTPEGEPHAYFSSTAGEYLMQSLGDRATIGLQNQLRCLTTLNLSQI